MLKVGCVYARQEIFEVMNLIARIPPAKTLTKH
jgi:hypothetical protein